ncbi:hypothetical protein SAMN04487895_12760 [Paenibacillus sophorae]|uniref:Helix-turn-helix transcriptional regulator n=1 Tax=Paenibacillus sophorae TaxID=1333845 RepID=A0A1H8VUF0_9BACL|nr:helix-turn-helix transcriptional regulator [Paenibacillus sophorae]QWU15712.1 helix-turn-helix transcriptional regulator [Paenibacillus sophorae]SEP18847.1 hypothetical protein SAMN04487895_12760 [Paenibacillus sophorae]
MKYSELLTQYIEASGLSLSEIAKRMDEEKGIKIDRSYISMLKNDKTKNPASEEMNRALAEITGGDPERLVLAAYYEKAPVIVKNSLKDSEQYRQFKKFIVESDFILQHFKDTGIDNPTDEMKEEAVVAFIDSITHDDFIELWHAMLKLLLLKNPKEFREIAKLTYNKPINVEEVHKLEELRLRKGLSREDVATSLSIPVKEYEYLELLGGFSFSSENSDMYKKAIDYLESFEGGTNKEAREFEAFMKNPEHGLFFKDYLEAPEERKKEMLTFWRFIKQVEEEEKAEGEKDK